MPEDGLCLGVCTGFANPCSRESIEYAGHDGQLHIDIDAHRNDRVQGIHVEEVDGITDDILTDHAPGTPINEFPGSTFHLIGDQYRWLVVS